MLDGAALLAVVRDPGRSTAIWVMCEFIFKAVTRALVYSQHLGGRTLASTEAPSRSKGPNPGSVDLDALCKRLEAVVGIAAASVRVR
jgi:hypothetical protein